MTGMPHTGSAPHGRPLRILAACFASALLCAAPRSGEAQDVPADAVSATLRIPRPTVYEHEDFDMVLAIEIRDVQVGRSLELAGMPDTKLLQFGQFKELPIQRVNRAGRHVEVRSYKCDVQALSSGTVAMQLSLRIGIVRLQNSAFGTMRMETPYAFNVAPLVIRVLPLPAPPPGATFSGAVGDFTFSASAAPTNLAPGDLVKVVSRISGRGWTENVVPPRLSPGGAFRVYEPKPLPPASQDAQELVFEQTLVPQTTNATDIPMVNFTYFSPSAGAYRTASAGPFRLQFQARRAVVSEETFASTNRTASTGSGAPREVPAAIQTSTRWTLVAAAATYWLVVALAMAGLASRVRRGVAAALVLLALAIAAFAGAATLARHKFIVRPTGVTIRQEDARISPAQDAFVTFTVPRDATVVRIEESGDWVKIETAGNRGWIPAQALTPAE